MLAQYNPINPFVASNDSLLSYYGSGDVNNDNFINWDDVYRLDSILKGLRSDEQFDLVYDRSDIDGDQSVNQLDFKLLEGFIAGNSDYLPSHWNRLKTKEERIWWLEKMLIIDNTNEQSNPTEYTGDYYLDQTIINLHGYDEKVFGLFESPPISFEYNSRFNLPVFYSGIGYSLADSSYIKPMMAIIVGDNVFDWNDWCFIDPQSDQLLFLDNINNPDPNQRFDSLHNWMDGIKNITRRDTILPLIQFFPAEEMIIYNSGHVDLEYSIQDENLKNAWYCIGEDPIRNVIYDDSMYLDVGHDRLVYAFQPAGILKLKLKNGSYVFTMEAEDLFSNSSQRQLMISVDDPPPQITIHSPILDSVYNGDQIIFQYNISDLDLAGGWYSLDSGLTKNDIGTEGTLTMQLDNGLHQLIVYAEDIFQNWSSDTLVFSVDRQSANVGLDSNKDSWMIIYPNPTSRILHIILNEGSEDIISLTIQDISGKVIWTYVRNQSLQMKAAIEVDLFDLLPGVYLLKASMISGGFLMHKIIKN
ncbi:MAG: T9SS type A sorting domain-containing protein [Bacteroidales bacterium]|nr:T9SS type A sorting domain-containing protein [Bacteroidales bacterium]